MSHPVSPLAPAQSPRLPALAGVRIAARECNVRYKNRTDVMLMELAPGTHHRRRADPIADPLGAGRSLPQAPQGRQGARHPGQFRQRQRLHRQGRRAPRSTAARKAAGAALGCKPGEVFLASTGVIGEPLPDDKITANLPALIKDLKADAWAAARGGDHDHRHLPEARHPARRKIGDATVTINGICQGLGHDRARHGDHAGLRRHRRRSFRPPVLQALLARGADRSFNCITVDGDTSTSDTLLLAATGQAGKHPQAEIRRRSGAEASSAPRSRTCSPTSPSRW